MPNQHGNEILISMTPTGEQHLANTYVDAIRNMAITKLLSDQIESTWGISSFSEVAGYILSENEDLSAAENRETQIDRLHHLVSQLVNAPIPGFDVSLEDVFQTQKHEHDFPVSVIEKTIAIVLTGLRQLAEEISDTQQRKEMLTLLALYETRYNVSDFDHPELLDTGHIIGTHNIIQEALGLAEDETLPIFSIRFLQVLGDDAVQSDHILGLLDDGADPQELVDQLNDPNGEYHLTTGDEKHRLSFNMALGLIVLAMTNEQRDSLDLKIMNAWNSVEADADTQPDLDVEKLVAFIRSTTYGG